MTEPMVSIFIICLACGALVGLLAGLLGIGGGLVVVPTLLYLFPGYLGVSLDVAMPMAIATSLATIVFTSWSSSRAHIRMRNILGWELKWLNGGLVFGALFGALLALSVNGKALVSIFGALVLFIALKMIIGVPGGIHIPTTRFSLSVIGVVTGSLSTLMGIGGGAIMVPAMSWLHIDIHRAIGTAALGGLILSLVGSMAFMFQGASTQMLPPGSLGYVYLPATAGIAITSVFAAPLGARIGRNIDTRKLRRLFALFLCVVSVRMIFG